MAHRPAALVALVARLRRTCARRPLAALTSVFVASRAVFWAMGVHPTGKLLPAFGLSEQLLAPPILDHDLWQSIYYLHSQPPLFNLELGLLLHVPGSVQALTVITIDLALGLALVVGTYKLLRELVLPGWLCFAAGVALALDPTVVLYEDWTFYTYPTAVLITWSALWCVRYVRTPSTRTLAAFVGGVSAIVLLNSSFQWPWLLVAIGVVAVVAGRRAWRQMAAVSVIAVVLVGGWYLKNEVVFGTDSTSSWIGMNLATITVQPPVSQHRLGVLVAEGKVSTLALLPPFDTLSAYGPALASEDIHLAPPRPGIPALDWAMRNPLKPNLNNEQYIAISSRYLTDDLHFIEQDPSQYVHNVVHASELWFVPSDQYFGVAKERASMSWYATFFDRVADWQVSSRPIVLWTVFPKQMSLRVLATYLIGILGMPLVAWWERRRRPFVSAGLGFIWVSTCYLFVVSNLVEWGENNRFRFDLGVLPTVGALVVVASVVGRLRARRAGAAG